MSHPASCHDPDCDLTYREHLLGIAISAEATPSRSPGVANTVARERVLAKDMDAYKAMRRQGLQPPHVDGSHLLAQAARSESEFRPLGEQFAKHARGGL